MLAFSLSLAKPNFYFKFKYLVDEQKKTLMRDLFNFEKLEAKNVKRNMQKLFTCCSGL